MNPIDLVKQELTQDELDNSLLERGVQELPDQCPFVNHRLFTFHVATGKFDFPTLPGGSYCMFAADGHAATRLTRKNKEICSILSSEWKHLPNADPVVLASLILKFYDDGIRSSHRVLRHAVELPEFGPNYQLNEREFEKTRDSIGETTTTTNGDDLEIRAVTLMGWMHDKRNLGIEHIAINHAGSVTFKRRMVLSKRIFKATLQIRY